MRIPQFFVLLAAACAPAASLPAQPATLAPFRSVSLSSGGHVLVRYGPAQSVSIVEGSARRAAFAVEDGHLAIGRCGPTCPHASACASTSSRPRSRPSPSTMAASSSSRRGSRASRR